MWFIQRLFALRQVRGASSVRLAPRAASMAFAVEELFDDGAPTPLGVYHTMRSMDDGLRAKFLRRCPEAKRLFDAKHERRDESAAVALGHS
jgi:hypothetical protein